jgi:hypothetical protein
MAMDHRKPWTWVCVQHPMPLLVQDKGVPDVLKHLPDDAFLVAASSAVMWSSCRWVA